ncbi:lipopolysaccharide heptosyltransferase family protein [Neokomagataea tanensis]|uniref:Lipopolysaccharide heptosyltransferase family protein n=1 Tax=Neokomagataea tanensis TaxID=661191 RepID=A0A4Y6V4H8_9PROT|nr:MULTISPECIES: glycosyltransferase family 9 protein [Neokomagataea]QDH24969.1 lipopolysaccharide heptosyltransferase family protein [Neokomagataea tanensis]
MERILIIKLGALGDFVQAFGAFASIKAAFPNAHITLLTTPPFVELAQSCPWFDEIQIDSRPTLRRPQGFLHLRRLFQKQDAVFDLQTSGRSARYRSLAPRGLHWSGISRGCSALHANPHRDDMHTLARLNDQLHHARIPVLARTVPDFLTNKGAEIAKPYVVLVPGAAPHRPQKRWPLERFILLAQNLSQQGKHVVIVGSPAEQDLGSAIHAACPEATNLVGQTTLTELAGVLHRSSCVIGNDTGPLHLAAAMDAHTITLFSKDSDPRLAAPLGITPGRTRTLSAPDLATIQPERLEALLPP